MTRCAWQRRGERSPVTRQIGRRLFSEARSRNIRMSRIIGTAVSPGGNDRSPQKKKYEPTTTHDAGGDNEPHGAAANEAHAVAATTRRTLAFGHSCTLFLFLVSPCVTCLFRLLSAHFSASRSAVPSSSSTSGSTIRGGSWPTPVDRKPPLVEKER
jgi:hypothetical protein